MIRSIIRHNYFPFKDNFLRRIPLDTQKKIREELRTIEGFDREIREVFRTCHWNHALFESPTWPLIALKFYMEKEIDVFDASRAFLYGEAREQSGFELHQAASSEGASLILRSMKEFLAGALLPKQPRLTHALLALKPEDGHFFSFQSELYPDNYIDVPNGLIKEGVPLFLVPDHTSQTIQTLVIPPKLWTAIFETLFGQQAIKIEPILGYDPEEDLQIEDRRVASIPSPFTKDPVYIHERVFVRKNLGLFLHDANYHLPVESAIPHRKVWIDIVQFIQKTQSVPLLEHLVDHNFAEYAWGHKVFNAPESSEEKFWFVLISACRELPVKDRETILKFIAEKEKDWEGSGVTLENLIRYQEKKSPSTTLTFLSELEEWTKIALSISCKKRI